MIRMKFKNMKLAIAIAITICSVISANSHDGPGSGRLSAGLSKRNMRSELESGPSDRGEGEERGKHYSVYDMPVSCLSSQ